MPNPDLGEVDCPTCGDVSPVRKSVKGKLYYVCSRCGLNPLAYPGGQDWILEHARMYGAKDKPPAPEPEDPPPEPAEDPPADDAEDEAAEDDGEADPAEQAGGLSDWLP